MSEYLEFGLGSHIVTNERGELVHHNPDSQANITFHQHAIALSALMIALDGQTMRWEEIKDHPALQEIP